MPTNKNKIRVVVVDDSFLMRRVISDILNDDFRLEVVATAKDGLEAIKKIKEHSPDVVTMDINMPELDGKSALKRIMQENPVPIIMISAYTKEDADISIECLSLGAVGTIPKPSGEISLNLEKVKVEMVNKIVEAAVANVKKSEKKNHLVSNHYSDLFNDKNLRGQKIIVIGSSTGGPSALEKLLINIKPNIGCPIIIAQHMPDVFINSFAQRLNRKAQIDVEKADSTSELKAGTIYILPGGANGSLIDNNKKLTLKFEKLPKDTKSAAPSVNELFISAANLYGNKTLGVVLTGMGSDGLKGSEVIKNNNGYVITQDEESSMIYGMPGEVFKAGLSDKSLGLEELAEVINIFGQL